MNFTIESGIFDNWK